MAKRFIAKMPKGCIGKAAAAKLLGITCGQLHRLIEGDRIETETLRHGGRKFFNQSYLEKNRESLLLLLKERQQRKRGKTQRITIDEVTQVKKLRELPEQPESMWRPGERLRVGQFPSDAPAWVKGLPDGSIVSNVGRT